MDSHKEELSKIGNQLYNDMHNLTRDFQIGFGSFVDKVLSPYVSTVPKL